MPDGAALPVLDHELADDELQWMKSVYADFSKARAAAGPEFNPKEALRAILARAEYRLSAAPDLTGPGPWRLGQNRHGRGVAAVFLPKVELHTHIASRTDQFPMYVMGEAEGFSIDENGKPVLVPVVGGSHFHNAPGAPHAFVPKVGIAQTGQLGNRLHRDHAAQPKGRHAPGLGRGSCAVQAGCRSRRPFGRLTPRCRLLSVCRQSIDGDSPGAA